jgi:hypothetical protein
MRVRPTSVVLIGECELQIKGVCTATTPNVVTAVFEGEGSRQVNVCRPCFETMVRSGEWEVAGARVRSRADIAVFTGSQLPAVIIEVKRAPAELGVDVTAWASRVRRNMLTHHAVPITPFFLLVSTDGRLFVWKDQETPPETRTPDYVADVSGELVKFIAPAPEGITESGFLDAVVRWVQSFKEGGERELPEWLVDSGLYPILTKGRVQTEVLV